jgi:hypothetical protein
LRGSQSGLGAGVVVVGIDSATNTSSDTFVIFDALDAFEEFDAFDAFVAFEWFEKRLCMECGTSSGG